METQYAERNLNKTSKTFGKTPRARKLIYVLGYQYQLIFKSLIEWQNKKLSKINFFLEISGFEPGSYGL